MATTSPDNIQYPVNSDQVAPLASHFKNLADSTQAALNNIKQTSRVYVKNGASPLTKGTPVYITGADGTNVIIGAASNASEANSSKVIGLTETDLTANAMGYVVTDGRLTNIDTSGAGAVGDPVWLGVDGAKLYGLANKPVAPAHMVYLGVVSRKNANTGEIEVKVQNGFELEELHNVLITNPQDKQVVAYEGGLWKNKQATGGVTVGATAPAGPNPGDAWYNSNNGMLYVWYVDADSTAQWVQVKANSGLEASILSRLGGLEAQAIAYGTQSPNYLINGSFDVWQRGTSFTNPGQNERYVTADQWYAYLAGNGTVTQETTTVPSGARYGLKVSATATASDNAMFRLVDTDTTSRIAGKTVTLSVYVSGTNGKTPTIEAAWATGVDLSLYAVGNVITPISTVSATTSTASFQRISSTFVVPATAKTLRFAFKSGSMVNGDYVIWGNAQLEHGTTATSFRRNQPNIQAELAACQRYYWRVYSAGGYKNFADGIASDYTQGSFKITFPVTMRTIPSSSLDAPTAGQFAVFRPGIAQHSVTNLSISDASKAPDSVNLNATIGSVPAVDIPLQLVANNNATAYLGFSAEL